MSSEPTPQPSSQPKRRPGGTGDHALGAAEVGRALGYDPDHPATWPGNAPDVPPRSAAAAVEEPAGGEPLALTDPRAMRAVAHPVRMALLELFAYRETLTATQASEALGESPANCAFHLRTLAKYGFVHEAGGGKGRERPWTVTNRSIKLTTNQPDPQAALAAGELGRRWLERWIDRARRVYGARNDVPGWDEASGWSNRYVFLTPDETIRLTDEMGRMLKRYEDRLTDPALRPESALPVEWTIFAAPVASELAGPGSVAGPDDPDPADGPDDPDADRQ